MSATNGSRLIAVLGSANADTLMRVKRLPRVGETVTDGEVFSAYGGKGANQAFGAARAGGNVAFIGCLGDDTHGRTIRDNCVQVGMDVSRLLLRPNVPTGSALVLFDERGDNYLAVAPGANYALTPEDIDAGASLLDSAAMLVMQMEIPVPVTQRALARAAERHVPVLFNFAPAHSLDLPVSSAMTGLVVNETEAEALWGYAVPDPAAATAAASDLLGRGPEFVIVTLGAQGVVIVSGETCTHIPAVPVTAVDSTGAGDTFCGALAVALVEGRTLGSAAQFASAAAALSVTRAGAQTSAPSRNDIDALLESRMQ